MADAIETPAQRKQRLDNEAIARRGNMVPRGYSSARSRYDADDDSRGWFGKPNTAPPTNKSTS